MKIQAVDGVVCGVDCFHPKAIRSLVLIEHGSSHLNECLVLPFGHSILLWSAGSRELVLDPLFIKVLFNLNVLKLDTVVNSYLLDLHFIFILSSSQESL